MKKPLFVVNGRFLSQKMTGVHRFAYSVCEALHRNGIPIIVLAPKKIQPVYTCSFPVVCFGLTGGPLWEMTDLNRYIRNTGHPLLFNFSGLGPIGYRNQVITIHDLAFLEHPEWYSHTYVRYYSLLTKRLAASSRQILTVSETSKKAITKRLQVPEHKITVVSNAADFTGVIPQKPAGIRGNDFILSVGSLDPRKNLEGIARAYAASGLKDQYQLCLVGKGDRVFRMVASSDISASLLGYVSDGELLWLYQHASLFVYPSFQEGFGIPPLEAMSQGCPVVLSEIPVFRELFEGAAVFADPQDPRAIGHAMQQVLSDDNLRGAMIHQGLEKAKTFNWEETAERIARLAEELLRSGKGGSN